MLNLSQNPARKSGGLFGLLAVLLLVFILWGGNRRSEKLAELEDVYRRIAWSQSGPVRSDLETLATLNQSIAELEQGLIVDELELFQESLGSLNTDVSGNSTAAFFEIASFVEGAYAKLEANGISFEPGDRLGFSQFVQRGPEVNILDAVMEQKIVAEYLMGQLVTAKPTRLTGIKREWIAEEDEAPQTALQQAAGSRSTVHSQSVDTIAKQEDRPGYVCHTFEISFEGYTDSLRKYLSGLVRAPVPILVKSVKVDPLERYAESDSSPGEEAFANPFELLNAAQDDSEDEGPVPIIRNNLSSFTLILEVVLRKQDGTG